MLKQPHLAHGCFFWKVEKKDKLLKLDMSIMELSTYDLLPGHHERYVVIAEAGEGRLALFSRPRPRSCEETCGLLHQHYANQERQGQGVADDDYNPTSPQSSV